MPALPIDFCYQPDSYSYSYQPSVVNTQFSTGRSRNRQIENMFAFVYSVNFDFNQDQFDIWEAFIYYDLQNGSLEFTAPYWNGSGVSNVGNFRFLPDTYSVSDSQKNYRVSFSMELIDRDMTAEDDLKAEFLASGQSWQEFGTEGNIKNYLTPEFWQPVAPTQTTWDAVNRHWYELDTITLDAAGDWFVGYRPSSIRVSLKQYLPSSQSELILLDQSSNFIASTGFFTPTTDYATYELPIDFSNGQDIGRIIFQDFPTTSGSNAGNYINSIQFVE